MFLQNAHFVKNDAWRYIVGTVLILIAWQGLGSIPFFVKLVSEVGMNGMLTLDETSMMTVLPKTETLLWLLTSFIIGFAGLWFVARALHGYTFRLLSVGGRKFDWGRVLFSFVLVVVSLAILMAVEMQMDGDKYVYNLDWDKFLPLLAVVLLLLPIQTSFEEYFFRGYLLHWFGLSGSRAFAFLGTSILFGLMHIINPEIAQMGYGAITLYIGTGLLLGVMVMMDDGLELALGFHAANNMFIALAATSTWTAIQTDSMYIDTSSPSWEWWMVIPFLIQSAVILGIFAYKYKWSNWNERLFGRTLPPPSVQPLEDVESY